MSYVRLTDDQVAARKRRNLAIAGGLVVFIVLVFSVTVLNLKRNIDARKAAADAAAASAPAPAGGMGARTPETAS